MLVRCCGLAIGKSGRQAVRSASSKHRSCTGFASGSRSCDMRRNSSRGFGQRRGLAARRARPEPGRGQRHRPTASDGGGQASLPESLPTSHGRMAEKEAGACLGAAATPLAGAQHGREILEGRHGLERPYHQGFDHHEIILHVLHTGGILGQDAKGLAFALVEDHPR